ncbi:hypothetical protein SAMN05518801_103203 [Novosphingobium sp. CF614]|uniref:hypothetical protein n=1 Tax=Novosphingobium sp. CF614 TaxID=1884364 RepID=UPI0008F339ED|nr:hypothetical protein [Novosphingobium sp. CF614]SFF92179.1 hypothetical protein SAMN05518801_103203 [Novosphingobium sp. CF614]
MVRTQLSGRFAALRAGRRWWPAEIALRGLGLSLLAACWRLALAAHRMATTPAPHSASIAELAVCTGVVFLLCGGLALAFVGPGLFLDIPLPPHFTRPTDFKP